MDKELPTNSVSPLSSHWQKPDWYAALQLTERRALLQTPQKQGMPYTFRQSSEQNRERATRRLRSWKTQKPFDRGTLFRERLEADALTEDDLLLLLAEPIATFRSQQQPLSSAPGWLTKLVEAFEDEVAPESASHLLGTMSDQQLAHCLRPILPLIQWGTRQLDACIEGLRQRAGFLPFDRQTIVEMLFAQLSERLVAQVSKTFVLEMHVARILGQTQGETTTERFTNFLLQLSQKERILSLLEEYPVLARQLLLTIEHWISFSEEFLIRLCVDWPKICATFSPSGDPGLLVEVQGGIGDSHRKGRSVLKLKFHSGLQLLYKPKSLATEKHFQELLFWLNEQGVQPLLRTIKVIDRGKYGWSEFVYAQSCTSEEEILRFYERQGCYLALLYVLNATDFHVENIIAAGEHPILVDLEALFQPQVEGNDPAQPHFLTAIAMQQSVLRVGLLPHRIWSNKEAAGIDLSGLGGEGGQLTPQPFPKWEGIGTDQMHLTRQRLEISAHQNRPKFNGDDVNVLDYQSQIISGFTSMYRLLHTKRDTIQTDILPRFARDEIRIILRPTARYATLLNESFHPDLLRDALERDCFFDHLWQEVEQRPALARVVAAERRDLLRGDLPLFTTCPEKRMLLTSDGEQITDFFYETGLELVKQRLYSLDEQDLARQTWVIEAALATQLLGSEQMIEKGFQIKPGRFSAGRQRLIDLACAIGNRLDQLATRAEPYAQWLGVSLVNERTWSLLPLGMDLYSGISGVALFLAYLGMATENARYTRLAKMALASVRLQVRQQKNNLEAAGAGVFDGLSSVIYLLMHLGILWKEPTLLQEAERLVEILPGCIMKDRQFDIIGGSAGCLLNLLGLYSVRPTQRTLQIALQCGDHLLTHAQVMAEGVAWMTLKDEKPLGGFSHGTAGIALSLLKLAEVSGQERYRQTALAALTYDRSLFLAEKQNWADLRTFPSLPTNVRGNAQSAAQTQEHRQCMVAWCHGAAGIGLSRLGALPYLDDETVREEIHIALRTTIREGFNGNHSLCHGALGNADVLLTATQVLHDPHYRDVLEQVTAMIVNSIDENGWVTGVPLGVETPGLMTGLAGIGYELLRLAEPAKIPSVLLIEPPAI